MGHHRSRHRQHRRFWQRVVLNAGKGIALSVVFGLAVLLVMQLISAEAQDRPKLDPENGVTVAVPQPTPTWVDSERIPNAMLLAAWGAAVGVGWTRRRHRRIWISLVLVLVPIGCFVAMACFAVAKGWMGAGWGPPLAMAAMVLLGLLISSVRQFRSYSRRGRVRHMHANRSGVVTF